MSGILQILLGGSQAPAVDPYFYSVTSLLHGDGTNGGQNNTFLDSSTNNFTITRNGNTTQGSFSPFSQTGWGNYFQGSGNYLTLADATQFNLSGAAYTIECWIYPNGDYGNYNTIVAKRALSSSSTAWEVYLRTGSGVLSFYNGTNYESAITPPSNQWSHIAAVYDGTNINLYLNGVRVLQSAITNSNISASVFIGTYPSYDERYIGHISNLRITKGAALYTGASFTVPTTALTTTVSSGTVSLLTCQSNRFIDNSVNAAAITVTGNPSVQPFSPFNPTTAYSTSAVGGSGYFDGAGDYLSIPDNDAWTINADYTIEAWVYANSFPQAFNQVINHAVNGTNLWTLFYNTSTGWGFSYNNGGVETRTDRNQNSPLGNWVHVAIVKSGTTGYMFLNGQQAGATFTFNNVNNFAASLIVGGWVVGNTDWWSGYITNLRILKGTALYTSNFTPPTSPLTAITNTQLLLNFTNGAIFDNAAVADYETVGNAQISTSVKKYGTGSIAFDGTGDYLVTYAPSTDMFAFGTGDFTVEFWYYSNNSGVQQILYDSRPSGTNGAYITFYKTSGNVLELYVNTGVRLTGTTTLSSGVWYHVALCRVASQTKIFVNGTQSGPTYADTTTYLNGANRPVIGSDSATVGNLPINGYIDDLRVTKGVGRYPYNFTPPTAEFPNIGGTVTLTADPYFDYTTLLLPGNGTNGAQNNTFLDSSTNAFSITRNGNTTQGTFSPFSQTGWGNFFSTTGSYLSIADDADFALPGDFTIETWLYPTNLPSSTGSAAQSYCRVFSFGTYNAANSFGLEINSNDSGNIRKLVSWYNGTSYSLSGNNAITTNQWTHVALVRSGTTITCYVNGSSTGTIAGASATIDRAQPFYIATLQGFEADASAQYAGYISNFSILKGTAKYTSNFTPSTTPLAVNATNQILLTCAANRFFDSDTTATAKVITAVGSPSVQSFSPFNPTAAWSAATNGGSGYFDGSGDYLDTATSSSAFAIGTGQFTVEAWVYTTDTSWALVSSTTSGGLVFGYNIDNGSQGLGIWRAGVGSAVTSGVQIPYGAWTHIAVSRDGSNNVRLYANGVQIGSTTSNTTDFGTGNQVFRVGADGIAPASFIFTGYAASVRVIKGAAQYTGTTYTVPTAPLEAVANTSLLLNFTNAGIFDATSKNDLETVGNAQISTAQSKFGGSSMSFDGNGDNLLGSSSPNLNLTTGDWTMEAWVYLNSLSASQTIVCVHGGSFGINWWINTSGQLVVDDGANPQSAFTGASISVNTWTHVALTRYGTTTRGFVNGLLAGSNTFTPQTCSILLVGRFTSGTTPQWFNGYIDDLRITKGIARYTSNFTVPTTAFLTL